jgi:hypothetical protein
MRPLGLGSYLRVVDAATDISASPDAYRTIARFMSQEAVTTTGGAPGSVQALLELGAPVGRVRWPCPSPDSYGVNAWHSDGMLAVYTRRNGNGVLLPHTGDPDDPPAPDDAFAPLVVGTDVMFADGVTPYEGCPCVVKAGVAPGAQRYVAYPVDPTIISNGLGPDWTPGTLISDLQSDGQRHRLLQAPFGDFARLLSLSVHDVERGPNRLALTDQVGIVADVIQRGLGRTVFEPSDTGGRYVYQPPRYTPDQRTKRAYGDLHDVLTPTDPSGRYGRTDGHTPDWIATRGAIKAAAVFSAGGLFEGPLAFREELSQAADGGDYALRCRIVFDATLGQWVVDAPSIWGAVSQYVEQRLETVRTNSQELAFPSWEPEPEPEPGKGKPGQPGETGDGDQEDADAEVQREVDQIEADFGGGGDAETVRRGGSSTTSTEGDTGTSDLPEGWTDTEIPEGIDPDYVGIDEALEGLPADERERLRAQYYRDRREYGEDTARQLLRTAIRKALARGQIASGLYPNVQGVSGLGLPQIGHIKGLGVIDGTGQRYEMTREAQITSDGKLSQRGTGAGWIGVGPAELILQRDWAAGSQSTASDLSNTMLMLYGSETTLGFGCLPSGSAQHGIASGTEIGRNASNGLDFKTYDADALQTYEAYHQADATTASQAVATPVAANTVMVPDDHRASEFDYIDVSNFLDVGDGAYFDVIDVCECS